MTEACTPTHRNQSVRFLPGRQHYPMEWLLVVLLICFGVFQLRRHGCMFSSTSISPYWMYLGLYALVAGGLGTAIVWARGRWLPFVAGVLVATIFLLNHFVVGELLFSTSSWIYDLMVRLPKVEPWDYYWGTGPNRVVYPALGELALGTVLRPVIERIGPYALFVLIRCCVLLCWLVSCFLFDLLYRLGTGEGQKRNWCPASLIGGIVGMSLLGFYPHDQFGFMLAIGSLCLAVRYTKTGSRAILLVMGGLLIPAMMSSTNLSLWIAVGISFSLFLGWIERRRVVMAELFWITGIAVSAGIIFFVWFDVGPSDHDVPEIVYDYVITYVFGGLMHDQIVGMSLYTLLLGFCCFLAFGRRVSGGLQHVFRACVGWCLFAVFTALLGIRWNAFAPFLTIWHRAFNLMILFVLALGLPAVLGVWPRYRRAVMVFVVALLFAGHQILRIHWFCEKRRQGPLTSIYEVRAGGLAEVLSQKDIVDIRKSIPKGSIVVVDERTAGSGLLQFWADIYTVNLWPDANLIVDAAEVLDRQRLVDHALTSPVVSEDKVAMLTKKYAATHVLINKRVLTTPPAAPWNESITKVLETDSLLICRF